MRIVLAALQLVVRVLDGMTALSRKLSTISVLVILLSMLTEVFSRYALRSSATWSYELSYMAFGAMFILGIGPTLQTDNHIRVDFLQTMVPQSVSRIIDTIGYVFFLLPCMFLIAVTMLLKLSEVFVSGETTGQSAWNPVLWPFIAILAVGLIVFVAQIVSVLVKIWLPNELRRSTAP
jgi:TRAP-type mannitol/chloroaromatic compound transport system permease small subunit